jgi:NAD(P)-dependent dehydrogenase (short-subunit alcohol dehydrogenase family)
MRLARSMAFTIDPRARVVALALRRLGRALARRERGPHTRRMALITTPFDRTATAAEVAAGIDLSGARAVVTGGASGIGVETARALAGAGAAVTLAVRDVAAGARVAAEIAATTGGAEVGVAPLDLTDRASIAAFVGAWDGPLDLLINNAGVMATPEERIGDGWELQFATNHLGHFALANGLHGALAAAGAARIVAVSSSANLLSPVVFDDLHFAFRPYDPWLAYGQAKTANILLAVGATARWASDGITANALNPGAILTNLQRHVGNKLSTPPELHKTPEQGAATTVLLATSPLLAGIGGRYFEDVQEAETVDRRGPDYRGVARYAMDPDNAERLWEVSLGLVG